MVRERALGLGAVSARSCSRSTATTSAPGCWSCSPATPGPATELIAASGEPMPAQPDPLAPAPPALAPRPDARGRRRRARAVAVLRAGRLAGDRGRGRARELPARRAGRGAAFARFEQLRRPRVEKIIRWAARMNSSKAAGPGRPRRARRRAPGGAAARRAERRPRADLRPPGRVGGRLSADPAYAERQAQLAAEVGRQPRRLGLDGRAPRPRGSRPNGSTSTTSRRPLRSWRQTPAITPSTSSTGEIQPCGR